MRFGGSNDERLSGERYSIGVGVGFVWMEWLMEWLMEWWMEWLMGVLTGTWMEVLMKRMVMLRRPVAITVSMPATEQSRCPMHETRDDHVFVGWLVWWLLFLVLKLWKKKTHRTRQGPTRCARPESGYGTVWTMGYVGRRRFWNGKGNPMKHPSEDDAGNGLRRWMRMRMWMLMRMYGNAFA